MRVGMPVAALFNPKARKWVQGRKHIFKKLEAAVAGHEKIVWVHCASLGEFEQGRPLIEQLRVQYPGFSILLTFFSPSGYEIRKGYKGADWVFYLPMDGPRNARRFLEIVKPSLVIFVKYEYWYYYLKKIKYRSIPLLLVSALFWKEMSFFKWYGALQRKMLSRFDHLFVQDTTSKELIDGIGLAAMTSISGDTRFDRVIAIAEKAQPVDVIEKFVGGGKAIIAGSTWPEDEDVLKKTMEAIHDPSVRLIIAPHEISEKHLASIKELFPTSIRLSSLQQQLSSDIRQPSSGILIIDNIGLLSSLYQYAHITYIGGGFGKGIHNTLEAAVYGKPVLFGPVHHKFREALELIGNGGAVSINNAEESIAIVQKLLSDEKEYADRCRSSLEYIYANRGATEKILRYIYEKRLLTN
jgi:3-deoxy-D-manno-octulosonic-acid transferase